MGHVLPFQRLGRRAAPALALAALVASLTRAASAQVVINEILPNPVGTDTGTERIEVYNAGPNPVDLTGWAIDDAATIVGWRPAPGIELPGRPNWIVARRIGEGGFGEVWLATQRKTRERRAFKFCYDAKSLSGLRREISLFRLLKEALGERRDITRIIDWNLETAPYFIEAEYTPGGNVREWIEERDTAKQSRDFAAADAIRNRLAAAGVELRDSPEGTTWVKKPVGV